MLVASSGDKEDGNTRVFVFAGATAAASTAAGSFSTIVGNDCGDCGIGNDGDGDRDGGGDGVSDIGPRSAPDAVPDAGGDCCDGNSDGNSDVG